MSPRDDEKPDSYPEPPDLKQVNELRSRMRADRAQRDTPGKGPGGRLQREVGKKARDIGTYTLIPSLMIAGPLVGYGLGYLVEKKFDIAPWGVAGGVLLGVLSGFRQVILILQRKDNPPTRRD